MGCGSGPGRSSTSLPRALHVDVRADSAAGFALHVAPPPVRVSLQRVTVAPPSGAAPPVSAAPPAAAHPEPPLPEAAPDTLPAAAIAPAPAAAPAAPEHAVLEPPVLRAGATLVVPARLRHSAVVELDVLVDAFGQIGEVRWAAGSRDTALVTAAERCASMMRFDPARLAGRPVDAWCRQRFEFGNR